MEHPFQIFQEQDHPFKAKDPKAKKKLCVECGKGRDNVALMHYGAPPRLDIVGPGYDPKGERAQAATQQYQSMKQAWQAMFIEQLNKQGMPRDLHRVTAETLICFPDRRVRDQGNFKFLLEKALGDALKDGGWLLPTNPGGHDDDCWYPVVRYEFGGLQATYEARRSYTQILVYPTLKSEVEATALFASETP